MRLKDAKSAKVAKKDKNICLGLLGVLGVLGVLVLLAQVFFSTSHRLTLSSFGSGGGVRPKVAFRKSRGERPKASLNLREKWNWLAKPHSSAIWPIE